MRRRLIVLLSAFAWVLAGCGETGQPAVPGVQPSGTAFELYTHCGINELKTDDGRFFERVDGPLTDGSGNPPPGWDNPYQSGRLVVTEDVAVFTDGAGHTEEFHLREGATDFLEICA